MRRFSVVTCALLSMCGATAAAANEGRYVAVAGTTLALGSQVPTVVLLDTETGRSWELSCISEPSKPLSGCSSTWTPLTFSSQPPNSRTPFVPPSAKSP